MTLERLYEWVRFPHTPLMKNFWLDKKKRWKRMEFFPTTGFMIYVGDEIEECCWSKIEKTEKRLDNEMVSDKIEV